MAASETSFKPGQTGNPGGRPKKPKPLQVRCVKAVDKWVVDAWILEVQSRGEDWVKCSELLAAYGYGKPKQSIEHTGNLTLEQLVNGSLKGDE